MKFCIAGFVICALVLQVTQAEHAKLTREDWARIQRICFNFLRTSPEVRERVRAMHFDEDNAETHCVTRCGGILSGFFDDETGPNLEKALAQGEGKPGFDEYKSELEQCVAAISPEQYGEDYCKKGFLSFKCSRNAYMNHIHKKGQ